MLRNLQSSRQRFQSTTHPDGRLQKSSRPLDETEICSGISQCDLANQNEGLRRELRRSKSDLSENLLATTLSRPNNDGVDNRPDAEAKTRNSHQGAGVSMADPFHPLLTNTFVYRPLDESFGEIRLLTLLDELDDDTEIRCTIKHVWCTRSSDSTRPFTDYDWGEFAALSYVWGNPLDTRTILLNGQPFEVTVNLFCALNQLRNIRKSSGECRPRHLWADAVCINQRDQDERNRQVQRMKYIFSSAKFVYCFLPPLRPPLDSTEDNVWRSALYTARVLADVERRDAEIETISSLQALISSRPTHEWQAFFELIRSPYWKRLWILQEFILAREVLLFAGPCVANHDDLYPGFELLNNLKLDVEASFRKDPRALKFPGHDLTRIGNILHSRQQFFQEKSMIYPGTTWITDTTYGAQASDDRDLVYGMMCFLSPEHSRLVSVDYAKTTVEVYTGYAAGRIASTFRLEVLPDNLSHLGDSSWPSWVVDLRNFSRSTLTREIGGNERPLEQGTYSPQVIGSDLTAYGRIIGTVDGLAAVGARDFSTSSPAMGQDVIQATLAEPGTGYHGRGTVSFNELWNCLLFGRLKHWGGEDSIPTVDMLIAESSNPAKQVLDFFNRSPGFILPDGNTLLSVFSNHRRNSVSLDPTRMSELQRRAANRIGRNLRHRRLASTSDGYIGLMPVEAKKGDVLCRLHGLNLLGVLRPHDSEWRWMGKCYVHDFMNESGGSRDNESAVKRFVIV